MKTNERFLVTISRELGSGGRTVGQLLADRLGVKFYDKYLLQRLVKEFGVDEKAIESLKGTKQGWWTEFCNKLTRTAGSGQYRFGLDSAEDGITPDALYRAETRILGDIAAEESCVVAGRAGFYVLRSHPNMLRVCIRASAEHRLHRVMERQNLTEAEEAIRKVDEMRENYVKHYTGTSRYDIRNYDLVLNMDSLSEEDAVEIIMAYIEKSGK